MATSRDGMLTEQRKHECDLTIPFPTVREAEIAFNTLSVDKEPRKEVTKQLLVEGHLLKVAFTASEARLLRVALGSFLDFLNLTIQTMELFGPPMKRARDTNSQETDTRQQETL